MTDLASNVISKVSSEGTSHIGSSQELEKNVYLTRMQLQKTLPTPTTRLSKAPDTP